MNHEVIYSQLLKISRLIGVVYIEEIILLILLSSTVDKYNSMITSMEDWIEHHRIKFNSLLDTYLL